MDKKDIASYNLEELTQEMKALGEKPFRARQIYAWLHQKLAGDFQEMTDLSKALRERLEAGYEIRKMEPVAHLISKKDPTEKFLFELADGNQIESVLMKYNYGNSVCIFISGRLPDGVPVLRLHHRRAEPLSHDFGDAAPDLPDPEDHRRAGLKHRGDGDGRAAG